MGSFGRARDAVYNGVWSFTRDLRSEHNEEKEINSFISNPTAYVKEKALEILKREWFYANFEETPFNDYSWPSHLGMSEEDVAFREKLDAAYQKLTQESIYDIKFDDEKYFDRLCRVATWDYSQDIAKKAYAEIAYEYWDELINKSKEEQNPALVEFLQLNSQGEIDNSPVNETIISALGEIVNKENQNYFFNGQNKTNNDKSHAYILYQLLNHQLKNDDMEIFKRFNDNLITKAFENRDKISDDYLQKLYQVAWFYNKGNIEPEILKSEYKLKFSTDIDDDVSHIDWRIGFRKYPIGSKRLDYLLSNNDHWEIAKHHADEFIKLPLEKLNKHFGEMYCYFNDNFEIKKDSKEAQEAYQAVLALKLRCIEKYGVENLSLTRDDCGLLGYRYLHGTRDEYEINFLRKHNNERLREEDSLLEKEFNKEGRTLYSIKDLPALLEYEKADKINLVLKDGYVVDDETQKYSLFNELINKTYNGTQKDEKYAIHLDNLLKNNEMDIKKAEEYEHFEIGSMMDFCVDICHKDNSFIFKPYIQRLVQKVRGEGNNYVVDARASDLQQIGIKVHYTQDLVSYRKRGIVVDYPESPKVYDFNEKFLCEASYHHSDGSHTTFLNEMLWYNDKKGTVMALNNGANPFTKAGFFRDNFEAMPFNMFFNRELKNNNEASLKDFMEFIASNIKEDKKGVIKDIWTSLGGKLRSDWRVEKIIHDTDQIIKTRFPSRVDVVRNRILEDQVKTQTDFKQGNNSLKFSGPKRSNGNDGR